MLKRKRDEKPELGRFGLSLAIGIIALVVLSLIGTVILLTSRVPVTPVALMTTATPPPFPTRIRTWTPLPSPTWVPLPTDILRLPTAGTLVYSTIMHEIGSFDGDGMHSLQPKGDDVAVSPDGQALAYVRDTQLFVYRGGEEIHIKTTPGSVRTPIWNADGTSLVFVVGDGTVGTVFHWDSATGQQAVMLPEIHLSAPPLPVPGVHRLLIAEYLAPRQTALYTIDELCSTFEVCQKSRQNIATLSHRIAWAAYHPSGIYIFFVEGDTGGLFALKTSTQEVIPLADDHFPRRRLVTGRDPTKLAYTDAANNLYLFDLDSSVSQKLIPTAVASISWTGGG